MSRGRQSALLTRIAQPRARGGGPRVVESGGSTAGRAADAGVLTGALTPSRWLDGVLTCGVLRCARTTHPKTARAAAGGGTRRAGPGPMHPPNRRPGATKARVGRDGCVALLD